MVRYRMCGGLAIMPDHDMAMLKDMSARGWHLSGFTLGFLYRFEPGEPQALDYAIDFQSEFSPEAKALYEADGWETVVLGPGWQIMRAASGSIPLHTDAESRLTVLSESRASAGRFSVVFAIATVLALAVERWFSIQGDESASMVCLVVAIVMAAGLVFSFLPFVGYTRSLRRIRANL